MTNAVVSPNPITCGLGFTSDWVAGLCMVFRAFAGTGTPQTLAPSALRVTIGKPSLPDFSLIQKASVTTSKYTPSPVSFCSYF